MEIRFTVISSVTLLNVSTAMAYNQKGVESLPQGFWPMCMSHYASLMQEVSVTIFSYGGLVRVYHVMTHVNMMNVFCV